METSHRELSTFLAVGSDPIEPRTVEQGGFLGELTVLAEILLDAQPVAIQLGQMI